MKNTGPVDDRALIGACINKDIRAWDLLVDKYSDLADTAIAGRLKKYGLVISREDIEDIRQDVFTLIWREDKLKSITNPGDISYWIAIVSGNAAINHVRKTDTRESLKVLSIDEKLREGEFADVIPSKAMNPQDNAAVSEIAARLDDEIKKLPSREKLIIKLHLIHGKKYHDIAGMLDIPKGTVSSYIKRAKEKLRKRLEGIK